MVDYRLALCMCPSKRVFSVIRNNDATYQSLFARDFASTSPEVSHGPQMVSKSTLNKALVP